MDYGILSKSGENSGRGRPSIEYLLTPTAARWLLTDIGSEKGREVIKFLLAREVQLQQAEKGPLQFDLSDPESLFRQVKGTRRWNFQSPFQWPTWTPWDPKWTCVPYTVT